MSQSCSKSTVNSTQNRCADLLSFLLSRATNITIDKHGRLYTQEDPGGQDPELVEHGQLLALFDPVK